MRYDHLFNRFPNKFSEKHHSEKSLFKHQIDYANIEKKLMKSWNPYQYNSMTTFSYVYGCSFRDFRTFWSAKPKDSSFLTNTTKKDMNEKLQEYRQAASDVGTSIVIKENATTITGRPLDSHIAVHIEDVSKRGAWWDIILKKISNEVAAEIQVCEQRAHNQPNPCQCETTMLMRNGCQCGGV